MRILFSCPTFHIGGFSTFTINMAQELKSKGHYISFFIQDPYGSLFNEYKNISDAIYILPRRFKSRKEYINSTINLINQLKPDLIINNAVPVIQAAFPFLSIPSFKISVLHSVYSHEKNICITNINYTDYIICVSENTKLSLSKSIKNNTEKIKVIPVGIPVKGFLPPFNKVIKSLKLIYVGRLDNHQKNLVEIIHILRELLKRKVKFEMKFIGEGKYLNELKDLLCKFNLIEQCKFTGSLPPDLVKSHIQEADVFLLTSPHEGTPHAVLESMALGTIPVVSNIPGSTDKIINNGENGFLCDYNNTNQYIEKILSIVESNELRIKLIKKAFSTIISKYSISQIVNEYEKLIISKDIFSQTLQNNILITQEIKQILPSYLSNVKTQLGNLYRSWFKDVKKIKLK